MEISKKRLCRPQEVLISQVVPQNRTLDQCGGVPSLDVIRSVDSDGVWMNFACIEPRSCARRTDTEGCKRSCVSVCRARLGSM